MKLLVITHSCATPVNQQLFAAIAERSGWEIDLVIPSNWRNEYGAVLSGDRWPAFKGRLLFIPVYRPGNIILHAYRGSFARVIRESNPDVIYMHHEPYALATAQVYWANVRTGKKPIGFYSAQNIQKRYPMPFRWTESAVFKRSSFAFPVSSDVENVLRAKGYAGRSEVLPLGIDTQTYFQRPNHVTLHDKLGNGADIVIGFVGRLVPEKGLTTLLSALAQVTDLRWKLVLVGSGPAEEGLQSQAKELGILDRIDFCGFVPHVETPEYLSALDFLVLPSETQPNWREQFGRVILEAIACKTPVLGSDSGEIPKLIHKTGGGLVFRERDVKDLADKLRLMIINAPLRNDLAVAGEAMISRNYSISVVADRFIENIRMAAVKNANNATMSTAAEIA